MRSKDIQLIIDALEILSIMYCNTGIDYYVMGLTAREKSLDPFYLAQQLFADIFIN